MPGFQTACSARASGYYISEVQRAAREGTGVEQATIPMYILSHAWKPGNAGLKSHARVLAKVLDLWISGKRLQAIDMVAGRLRAYVHVDLTGSWSVAENLQSEKTQLEGALGNVLMESRATQGQMLQELRLAAQREQFSQTYAQSENAKLL